MSVPNSSTSTPSHMKPAQMAKLLRESKLLLSWPTFDPTSWEELKSIHSKEYLSNIQNGINSIFENAQVIWSTKLVDSLLWTSGSMIAATHHASEFGIAVSLSSGFHHAHYEGAGTFCLVNGLVLAALKASSKFPSKPVAILDCDYHYGNGTDDILGRFIHNPEIQIKHFSLGKHFKKPIQANDYINKIKEICKRIEKNEFNIVLYQSGMDVLIGDPMGGGILTPKQTYERDLMIFQAAQKSKTPIVWNLAGGYKTSKSDRTNPVLLGHMNTFRAAKAAGY